MGAVAVTTTAEKVIKTRDEYDAVLAEIDRLAGRDPAPGTAEGDRLELLAVLARDYESRTLPPVRVDPVEAIVFRMEQQGLRQRDLVPFIGSKSKVSEVLSGRRPLTLSMIRALHAGLGIPAEALLGPRDPGLLEPAGFEWERFPLGEMVKRHWIMASAKDLKSKGEELVRQFLAPLGRPEAVLAMYRQTGHVRSGRQVDYYALTAWTACVVRRADEIATGVEYHPESITLERMREVVKLSWSDQGPQLAREFLAKKLGIPVVIERHLSSTHLDGAAILGPKGPVIGLTVRHDRLDNFWYCLMHELVHVAKHFTEDARRFYDDLDVDPAQDTLEQEADDLASEALIPKDVWAKAPARTLHSVEAVHDLANKLQIHPAIVAGRIRHERRQYRVLSGLVGQGQVSRLFSEIV